MKKIIFLAFCLLFPNLLAFPATAAEEEYKTNLDAAIEREVTIIKDMHSGEFLSPTLQNLSHLYWKLGAFRIEDDIAVDNYLLVNECEIYKNYIQDDIEWLEIRKMARKKIEQESGKISSKFQFVLPINVGDYDTEKGGFEIINNTGFPNLKRLEFSSPLKYEKFCNGASNVPGYNKNVLLMFEKPLDYQFLELDDHVAQAFILRQKDAMDYKAEIMGTDKVSKKAYVRLRMNIQQYQGTINRHGIGPLSILYGTLDGMDIFEDLEQTLLLQSLDFSDDGQLVPVKNSTTAVE